MRVLTIKWQRLIEGGETCPRCGDTGTEVQKAAEMLRRALAPRSIEEWLGGTTGQSPCCDVCGPNDCRTVTVDGQTYEAIPADLIVRAGLLAAASSSPSVSAHSCCAPSLVVPTRKSCCS